ncbi:leucyl aminopeptidase family protein [Sphingomonas colocasiae]|uniref:Leucyl aminopeptidase family protein n=1 Tax=Sphingomonas colocasiae TaxID=1848973 RepID=A0ABS7PUQ2_9SPHN|nr:leucyl aminopeptidase family protein [Sphingomonas colocasiae]MBY8824928.1 leucyl aminopeptidase family protein [Sphingomonas colocasiae]
MTNWTTIAVTAQAMTAASPSLVLAQGEGDTLSIAPGVDPGIAVALRGAGWAAKPGRWFDWIGAGGARALVLGHDTAPQMLDWLSLGGHLVAAMRASRIADLRLPAASAFGPKDGAHGLEMLLTGALLHGFSLDHGRRDPSPDAMPLRLVIDAADQPAADRAIRTASPVNRARAWVEQPANLLTPMVFAQEAAAALTACGAETRILDRAELERRGFGGVLAVGQASRNAPCVLIAEWRGAPARAGWDAVMVGKGVTFDSGGLNLKTRPIIEKMKFDMGGAAAVLGAFEAAVTRAAAANVAVVVPMAENAIGSNGYRPGDVIRMLSGQTVEVLNTDAEGRLILADGVTHAIADYDPRHIVDVATLTGMITGVLHEEYGGIYASDDGLADALLAAGVETGELLWRLPLTSRQDYLVDSQVADVANLGAPGLMGLGVGSPAAGAKFVERFARGRSWAHIDIAGTVWATRRTERSGVGATGFGVALLDRWIAAVEGSAG